MHSLKGFGQQASQKTNNQAWPLVKRVACGLGLLAAGLLLGACSSLQTAPPVEPGVLPVAERRELRLGLALGGGAARGFAHVGVIQVLEQNGIRPDLLVGTSAGSMVAAMYASGKSASELEAAALTMEEATLTDWSLPILGRGMLRGEALTRYVRQAVGGKLLEALAQPYAIHDFEFRCTASIGIRRVRR